MSTNIPIVVGIVNCTPDSFSDGLNLSLSAQTDTTTSTSTKPFIDRAQSLIDDGADMLELGGDSTRPGSLCVADEEEWHRIEPVLRKFSDKIPISVDTHKAEIARRAIDLGAMMINDITGGADSALINTVATSSASFTFMFNSYGCAHTFSGTPSPSKQEIVGFIQKWATQKSLFLDSHGISPARQVMDTGMGAFLSSDPGVSLEIIEHYWDIRYPGKARMLACSRKGFLKKNDEIKISDRDLASAEIARRLAILAPTDSPFYIRVHNVALHRRLIDKGLKKSI
jgi:dihydropteroate synthase